MGIAVGDVDEKLKKNGRWGNRSESFFNIKNTVQGY